MLLNNWLKDSFKFYWRLITDTDRSSGVFRILYYSLQYILWISFWSWFWDFLNHRWSKRYRTKPPKYFKNYYWNYFYGCIMFELHNWNLCHYDTGVQPNKNFVFQLLTNQKSLFLITSFIYIAFNLIKSKLI